MRLQKINKLIIVAYLLMAVLTLASTFVAEYYQKVCDQTTRQQQLSLMQADQLLGGSKYLTNAVRSFAATGNSFYENAYHEEVTVTRSRDKAVDALKSLGITQNEFALISSAKLMSDTLIDLENRSFKSGREGDLKLAVALVYGSEYQEALDKIYTPISQFREMLQKRLIQNVENAQGMATASRITTQFLTIFSFLMILVLVIMVYHRRILKPILDLSGQVQALLRGDNIVKISYVDESTEIGDLARSIEEYQKISQSMDNQHWIKSTINELSARLQNVKTFTDLAQALLSYIAPLLDVGHGVFYLHDVTAHNLRLIGSYGYRERKNLNQYFAYGEGLVGQSAMEKVPITLTNPPDDYIMINSGLGEATPRIILVLPVLLQDHVQGVIELASFRQFKAREMTLLDQMMPMLAMNLEILERNIHTRRLLKETQDQAERMEQQAAQLEEQAVEMEAQQIELKETESWYLSILESVPTGMLVTDDSGAIVLYNHIIEALFAYSGDELIGKPIRTLIPAIGSMFSLKDGDGLLDKGAGKVFTAISKDGSKLPITVELSTLPILDGRGKCSLLSVFKSAQS